ncbi:bifunctional precorrin-2 dehydrogenase/sirohydrochlorin ferrochelatase [Paenibacillus sp. PAMC21692]|uniref:precorrin-2 dehydrogenase/sirohydrochlorin ferrochelatase family protein n=1 Tax=Paenibacillus sp. PAMC21692 TaxID=2762320 RepID=UPI00164E90E7|nr:bifunctional precorrin-2 dehydrogenase/sirohydrochlorin ferrochelatase [Paenibacillus sp. PAMC21692]QNK60015.1 bifunctional precorrin-2 dehydrogenase/sirohydrochlorin ferrochelatase [Paenibacillus sp. PAMC21692]
MELAREQKERPTYYAVALDLKGKLCAVIGGGIVAERKLKGLLEGGADRVRLVSPAVTPGIAALADGGNIILEQRAYQESDLKDVWMAFACTDDAMLNAAIALAANRRRIWCNVADDAASGSFISPSMVRRGDLLLAVTASGASPSLSALIKTELERQYGPQYEEGVERLRQLREYVCKTQGNERIRREVLRLAAEGTLMDGGAAGTLGLDEWYAMLLEITMGRQMK